MQSCKTDGHIQQRMVLVVLGQAQVIKSVVVSAKKGMNRSHRMHWKADTRGMAVPGSKIRADLGVQVSDLTELVEMRATSGKRNVMHLRCHMWSKATVGGEAWAASHHGAASSNTVEWGSRLAGGTIMMKFLRSLLLERMVGAVASQLSLLAMMKLLKSLLLERMVGAVASRLSLLAMMTPRVE